MAVLVVREACGPGVILASIGVAVLHLARNDTRDHEADAEPACELNENRGAQCQTKRRNYRARFPQPPLPEGGVPLLGAGQLLVDAALMRIALELRERGVQRVALERVPPVAQQSRRLLKDAHDHSET
jgi:hypothetical protein